MDEEQLKRLRLVTLCGLALSFGAGVAYLETRTKERIKRKQIEDWKHENLALIAASQDRVIKRMQDRENYTLVEALRYWHEEQQFLNIAMELTKPW